MSGEVLSDGQMKRMVEGGAIKNVDMNLHNPGSWDLRLDVEKWKLLASVSPLRGQSVKDLIENSGVVDVGNNTKDEFYLDRNQPYLFKLMEELKLPSGICAKVFNKSGRGRIGTSVRILCDGVPRFDQVPLGYKGPLYAEVTATAFPEVVSSRMAMPQIRFYEGSPQRIKGFDLELLLKKEPILLDNSGESFYKTKQEMKEITESGRLVFTADLSKNLLAYRAKQDARTIDLRKKEYYNSSDFFIEERFVDGKKPGVIVHPGEFVLVGAKQNIRLPENYAGDIDEYSPEMGDMKSHYAGIINPGHGYTSKFSEDHIVFEMRARDIPIFLYDGKPLASFGIYKMSEVPEEKYVKKRSTSFDCLKSILPSQFKKSGNGE